MSINREAGPLKWNLNSILAVGGASITVIAQIVTFTVLWTNNARDVKDLNNQVASINKRLDDEANERKDRIKDFTKTQTDMQAQIATIVPLSYQVTQAMNAGSENKEAIKQTNVRIDKVVESVSSKIDNVLKSVNDLSSNIAVLNSKLEDKTQKTAIHLPVYKP